ncbi:MAG: MlaD family protein, partial [Proteobacteria bacterium]|nr:MlaD family protein [Pseudomonadota bacterium]
MSKQINKTLVGGFVVGALALLVVALVIFGSGAFFKLRPKFVLYFDTSVKGLNVGSPVNFRGVPIGAVTDVQLQFNVKDLKLKIPVFVELYPERISMIEGERNIRNVSRLIEKGLRAQLKMQSLITGQLMIELDFYDNKPAVFLGDGKISEIPTIQSSLDEISRTLANIPFEQIADKLAKSIEGIERIVNSPELSSTLKSLDGAIKDIQSLVRNVDNKIGPLASEYGLLAKNVNGEIDKLADAIAKTLATAEQA